MPKIRKTKGIYRRGRIYWITYMGIDGKQKYESTGSDLKADAELVLAQRRLDIDQGKDTVTRRKDRNHTFNDLADKYKKFIVNQKAARSKRVFIAELCREFGTVKLANVSLSHIEGWQSRRLSEPRTPLKGQDTPRPPLKASSLNRIIACLKHMFAKALDWEMITVEISNRVKKVKPTPDHTRRLRYLSLDECSRLLAACDNHIKAIATLALHTGCRQGEILGLTWNRVDLKHGFILLDDTKSGKRREIPINNTVRATILGVVRRLDIPYVFWNPTTETRWKDIHHAFNGSCRKAGLQDFHFHDLRHTFASQLVMNGVDITTVSKLLGHATLTMTLRYAHLAPGHLKTAVDVMSGLTSSHDILHDNRTLKA